MRPPSFLLAVNQDGVLEPSTAGPGDEAVIDFSRVFEGRGDVVLVYLAESHLVQSLELIREAGFPDPDYLACDAGTTLYQRRDGTYSLDAEYRKQVAEALGSIDAAALRHVVAETFPHLLPQEFDHQGEFKLSYYVDSWGDFQELIATLRQVTRHIGAHVRMLFSIEPGGGRGRLQLLPEGVSKASLLRRLSGSTGLPPHRIVYVSGGAPEDQSLVEAGYACVFLRNMSGSAVEALKRHAAGHDDRIYFASAENGTGVVEGCRALGFVD